MKVYLQGSLIEEGRFTLNVDGVKKQRKAGEMVDLPIKYKNLNLDFRNSTENLGTVMHL